MAQGQSGQVVDITAAAPGQEFRIRNARVTMFTGASGCTAAFIDWSGEVELSIDGLLYVDPQHTGPVAYSTSKRYELENVLAFGDPEGTCNFLGSGRIRHSWITGWNRLFKRPTHGMEGVYWAAAASVNGGPRAERAGRGPERGPAGLRVHRPAEHPAALADLRYGLRRGAARRLRRSWSARQQRSRRIGTFGSASVALEAPLEGLLIQGRRLLRCKAAWGESGANVGRNLVAGPVHGLAILEPASCPLAAPQLILEDVVARLPVSNPPRQRALRAEGRGGPCGPVRGARRRSRGAVRPRARGLLGSHRQRRRRPDRLPADPGCAHGMGRGEESRLRRRRRQRRRRPPSTSPTTRSARRRRTAGSTSRSCRAAGWGSSSR